MIIELHMLQNFAPSCLNRDDTGAPKECEFGGYRRARISSQCIKRAIRDYFRETNLLSPEDVGYRTKKIQQMLVEALVSRDKSEDEAKKVVLKSLIGLGLEMARKMPEDTEYLMFVCKSEVEALADTMVQYWDKISQLPEQSLKSEKDDTEKGDTKKAGKKAFPEEVRKALLRSFDAGKAVDLALFGRMIADLPEKNIDAACQVSHAISTNKVNVEFDYFTAVDDLQPEEKTGAGMVGTMEFNSACYYRYANVDVNQLVDNLLGKPRAKATADELKEARALASTTIEAFIKASVNAIPTGKQTSMSAQNPPDFVFAVARDYGAWSLANAFARPVYPGKDGDVIQQSVVALVNYWNRLARAYGTDGIKAKPAFSLAEVPLDGLEKVENLDALIVAVDRAVTD